MVLGVGFLVAPLGWIGVFVYRFGGPNLFALTVVLAPLCFALVYSKRVSARGRAEGDSSSEAEAPSAGERPAP